MSRVASADFVRGRAPALVLETEHGATFDLADHRDRPTLVTFLSHGG